MTNVACDLQPVDLHGSHGREYATGRGAVLATRELLLHAHAGKIANKDFIIQVRFSHFALLHTGPYRLFTLCQTGPLPYPPVDH